MAEESNKIAEILLVEDNPGDVRLTKEALRESLINHLFVVGDGEQAMEFLHRKGNYEDAPRPAVVLLDLNLPKKDGREVLAEIRADDELKSLPVIVMTSSKAQEDFLIAERLDVNCYLRKPIDPEEFVNSLIASVEGFELAAGFDPTPVSVGDGKVFVSDPSPAKGTRIDVEPGGELAEILLVEDNPADVRLILEALRESARSTRVHVTRDGEQALEFLRREGEYEDAPRPAVVLLDLNLPKKSGSEVLREIKTDRDLRDIPVVILSTSQSENDIASAYLNHANCYIVKRPDLDQFFHDIGSIANFWLKVVKLPSA